MAGALREVDTASVEHGQALLDDLNRGDEAAWSFVADVLKGHLLEERERRLALLRRRANLAQGVQRYAIEWQLEGAWLELAEIPERIEDAVRWDRAGLLHACRVFVFGFSDEVDEGGLVDEIARLLESEERFELEAKRILGGGRLNDRMRGFASRLGRDAETRALYGPVSSPLLWSPSGRARPRPRRRRLSAAHRRAPPGGDDGPEPPLDE